MACSFGKYSTGSAGSCATCLIGNFCSDGAIYACSAGTYQPNIGQGSCLACVAGSYCVQAATSLLLCDDGYFSNPYAKSASDCFLCNAGSFCKGGALLLCSAGKYQSLKGQTSCVNCVIGSYCPQGSVSPTPCPVGKYSISTDAASAGSCTTCAAGTYQLQSGQIYCLGCLAGYFCGEGALVPCPAGSFSSTINATIINNCQFCSDGYWGNEHSTENCVQLCPEGYYCKLGVKEVCGGGYYCSGGKKTACSRGKYSSTLTASTEFTCLPCAGRGVDSAGFSSIVAASSVSMCKSASCLVSGYQGDDGYCQCAIGYSGEVTYTVQDQSGFISVYPTGCNPCGKGNYCPNSSTKIPCPKGKYSETLTAFDFSTCLNCPDNSYSITSGASTCVKCEVGFKTSNNNCVAVPCVGNGYTGDAGSCKCSPGFYGVVSYNFLTLSGCNVCSEGYFCSGEGRLEICKSGYYCSLGSIYPLPCEKGKYSSVEGTTICVNCKSGFYSKEKSTTCFPISCSSVGYEGTAGSCSCSIGYYGTVQYKDGVLDGCITCGKGYYCNDKEGRIACPKGTFSSLGNASSISSCIPCLSGTFNNAVGGNSISSCRICSKGTHSSSGADKCVTNVYSGILSLSSESNHFQFYSNLTENNYMKSFIQCPSASDLIHMKLKRKDLQLSSGRNSIFCEDIKIFSISSPSDEAKLTIFNNACSQEELTIKSSGLPEDILWNYIFTSGNIAEISLNARLWASNFHISFEWECITSLPLNPVWHTECVSNYQESRLFKCSGCTCCGDDIYWYLGKCDYQYVSKTAAASSLLFFIFFFFWFSFTFMTTSMVKSKLGLLAMSYFPPISILYLFLNTAFSLTVNGNQWSPEVYTSARILNALFCFQPSGIFISEKKLFGVSISITKIKIVFLNFFLLFSVVSSYLVYKRKIHTATKLRNNRIVSTVREELKESRTDNPVRVVSETRIASRSKSAIDEVRKLNFDNSSFGKATSVFTFLLLMVFPQILDTVISYFQCIPLYNSDVGIVQVLQSDESFQCWDRIWYWYLPFVYILMILGVVGIPLYIIILVYTLRKKLNSNGELLKSGHSLDNFYNFTEYLCQRFHPLHFEYEFILLTRRAFIQLATELIISNPPLQTFIISLVLFISAVIHLIKEPFRIAQLNEMEIVLISILEIIIFGSFVLQAAVISKIKSSSSDGSSLGFLRSDIDALSFQNPLSHFIFWSCLGIGVYYSIGVFREVLLRDDFSKGEESSQKKEDRGIKFRYNLYFRYFTFAATFLNFIMYLVCAVLNGNKVVEIALMVILWLIFFTVGIYVLLFSKSNKIHVISRKEEEREKKREIVRLDALKEKKDKDAAAARRAAAMHGTKNMSASAHISENNALEPIGGGPSSIIEETESGIGKISFINHSFKSNLLEVPAFVVHKHIEMLTELKKTCPICFEPYQDDKVIIMKCGHDVCIVCFAAIDKCHTCRKSF